MDQKHQELEWKSTILRDFFMVIKQMDQCLNM